MAYKRILTIQDISCLGQCSLTVALPILSACGIETCILPSAVLSTHTYGFKGYTFRDLSDDIPAIQSHWQQENINFDAVYTGYLGSTKQVAYVKDILETMIVPGGISVVDPAMADHGKLYPGFDEKYVAAMRELCAVADVILPNITEACMLTGHPYTETYNEAYVKELINKLLELGARSVVLTGIGYKPEDNGVVVFDNGEYSYYKHHRIPKNSHGTGDVYASCFVGAYMQGRTMFEAAKIAADYTVACIENTIDDDSHWYGVKFEKTLPKLIELLNK